jgi:acetylornithine aminotransferase
VIHKTNSINSSLLQKDATVPNPDPSPDSLTVSFINERAPFMVPTYVRPAPMMMKGQGCYLWDMENRRYLDFTAGIAVNSLGHCDPEIAKIIAEQVRSHRFMQTRRNNC